MQNMTQDQVKQAKGLGFLRNKGTDKFSARISTDSGMLSTEQLKIVCDAANLYGNGDIAFTVRQTIEIPGIRYEDINDFCNYISKAGLTTGGTGPRVRPILTCKGSTCINGLCDTKEIAGQMEKLFYKGYYDVALPGKFKIALAGCPNNCVKAETNDLGIIAQHIPEIININCSQCQKCNIMHSCPAKAIAKIENNLSINRDICINCGSCITKCPNNNLTGKKELYKIYVGGKWGKQVSIGQPLQHLFSLEDALNCIEKSILLYKRDGKPGDRLVDIIVRMGIHEAEQLLLSNGLLEEKSAIINK